MLRSSAGSDFESAFKRNILKDWKDIVAVSGTGVGPGPNYANSFVGLKKDGTVIAYGDNKYGECDVQDWKDIAAVSANSLHSVGLKKDGTVVATGNNKNGQCNVGDWKDIVSISVGMGHTVG